MVWQISFIGLLSHTSPGLAQSIGFKTSIRKQNKQTKNGISWVYGWYILGREREKKTKLFSVWLNFFRGQKMILSLSPFPLWSHQRPAPLCGFVLPISLLSGTWYYLSLEGYPVSPRSPLSSGLFCWSFLNCQNNTHSASNVCPISILCPTAKCVQWLLQHLVWLLSWLFCDLRSTSHHIPTRVSQEPLL